MSDFSGAEKILVTGGTGFLGKYVLDELIAKGVQPFVLTRNPSREFEKIYRDKIRLFEADLLDYRSVERFFEEHRFDRIAHLAGSTGKQNEPPEYLERVNYEATVNLLELAAAFQVKRVVITGTADEYGSRSTPQTELMPTEPISDYAVSKNKAVKAALSLHENQGLPVIILRPFTIYGIGQPSRMFISQAVESAVKKLPFAMSEGFQKRDLVFVTDFADAMMKALTAERGDGEIFNVGSGKAIALRDLAIRIWKLAGADIDSLKIGTRYAAAGELHDTQADIAKITGVLSWNPKISLDAGLKLLIKINRQKVQ